ncbi:MAG: TonB-dependent receptor plug domain-containing protein [Bacteroidales bacterium]
MGYIGNKCALLLGITLISFDSIQAESLHKDTLSIPEVVVTGSRNEIDIRHLPMSITVVTPKQIEGRYEQSLLPLLNEHVPGLFTTSRGVMGYGVSTGSSGGMTMRGVGGSPTTGVLILIDGHPQYMGLMGHPIADAYQSMLADRVEVVRGPASVLYGSNAMGGVINILTKSHKENGFGGAARLGYGSFNTLNSELNLRYRKDRLSTMVMGSYNRTDGHRDRIGFEQYGGYAKVGYDLSQEWNVFVDLNLTHFNASNPGTTTRPIFENDSRITRGMSSLSLENKYEKSSGALKIFYNFGKHNINDGYFEGETPRDYLFNSKDNLFGLNWYQSATLFSGNRITVGLDYQRFGGEAWNRYNDGSRSEIIDKAINNVAGYVDFRQSLGSYLTLDAGLRLDHHTVSGTNLIPQFGASLYPTTNGEMKLLASRGFRNPTIREMYMFPPQNPDLRAESLWSYEVSWSQRLLNSRLSYGANLYYIKGSDMIQTIPVDGRPLNVNIAKVENWGVELSTSYRVCSAISLMANYSYLNMSYELLASPKHKFYAGVDFNKGRWVASTGVQYISGLYTSISNSGSSIQENFTLWSLRASYRATKWMDLFVKGENLLNQSYEINLGYPMPGTNFMGGVNLKF